jgi:CBS domain-containing protein
MTRGSLSCRHDDSLNEAAARMWEGDCGALPVLDEDGHVVGVITDRDVCMAAFTTGQALANLPVARAMSTQVATIEASASLADALHVLRSRRIRRLPVVDAQQCLVGMLSLADLARALVDRTAPAAVHLSHEMVALALADIVAPRVSERETVDVIEVVPTARQAVAFDDGGATLTPGVKTKAAAKAKKKSKSAGKQGKSGAKRKARTGKTSKS